MGLEQLYAFLEDRPQETLGLTIETGPDNFPMLESSDLRAEHELLNEFLSSEAFSYAYGGETEDLPTTFQGDEQQRTRNFMALLERIFAYVARLRNRPPEEHRYDRVLGYGPAYACLAAMTEAGVNLDVVAVPMLRWLATHGNLYDSLDLIRALITAVSSKYGERGIAYEIKQALIDIRSMMVDMCYANPGESKAIVSSIDELIGEGAWQVVLPGEVWTDRLVFDVEAMPPRERKGWFSLLQHCGTANAAKPNGKWTKAGMSLLKDVGEIQFASKLMEWFPHVDKGRTRNVLWAVGEPVEDRQRINDYNADVLRGLLWLCVYVPSPEICRAISKVAISAYRKVRGLGPRAVKVGNAAVYVLGEIANEDAVGQLAVLKVRVKFSNAQKGIEKALETTAERVGIPRHELEELSVPSYGLTEIGLRRDDIGDYQAETVVVGSRVLTRWFNAEGKELKTAPTALKKDFSEDLKELKLAASDIEKMIPVQSARIEQTYLEQTEWEVGKWRQRYLDHPLVGAIAGNLIWQFSDGDQSASAIPYKGRFVDANNRLVDWITDDCKVQLWHPLHDSTVSISDWREWLFANQVRQPFKQAHREIYIITDAERNSGTYSNRFAAHILKQHQFNALCLARGWKNKLRLMVDDTYPPAHRTLLTFGIRAEFWIEGAGTDYGVDTNESGTYLYLATDQVRFYRNAASLNLAHAGGGGYESGGGDVEVNHPLPLDQIPAIVFSEIMRDVDLFVGVASVGTDPNWFDGGAGLRYRDYWNTFSFGELGTSAQLRKVVLERLMPKLKIADRCSFSDRFLVVRGDLRTYKIHFGSGNILMEPNDQYLCIVAKQSINDTSQKVFLPFEGDGMLSIILSKAFLLAEDTKIKDSSIINQIGLVPSQR